MSCASCDLHASVVLGLDSLFTLGVQGRCWNTARLLLLRPRATCVESCKPCQMRPSIVHSGKLAMCTSFPCVRRLPSSPQLKSTTCKDYLQDERVGVPEVVHAVPYILLYAEIGVSGGEERNGGTLALLAPWTSRTPPLDCLIPAMPLTLVPSPKILHTASSCLEAKL